jgi:sporulation protein YlmC with PRC-barrel domain
MGERVVAQHDPKLDPAQLYERGWSADQMIGTEARDVHGEPIGTVRDLIVDQEGLVRRAVIGVSGVLGVGERYIGVPWNELDIGHGMAYVQTAVREEHLPEFSLFTGIEDDVAMGRGDWRVNELIGEFASLEDVERYGIVSDVIFDERGQAQAVVVARGAGWWGGPDWYAFPYVGFDPAAAAYPLPYSSDEIGALARFDYLRFGQLSPHATAAAAGSTVMPRAPDSEGARR